MPQVYRNLRPWVNLLILSRVPSRKKKKKEKKNYSAIAYLCNTLWNFSPENRRLSEPVVHCSSYRLISLSTVLIIDMHIYFCKFWILATRLTANISLDLKWDILKESHFRSWICWCYISWYNSYCLDRQWKSLYGARTARELIHGGWRLRAISADLMSGLWFERMHDRHGDRTRSD